MITVKNALIALYKSLKPQKADEVRKDKIMLYRKKKRMKRVKNLKLKSARALMDLSQEALAEKVGVSRQTINAIEKGDYNPTIKLCIAICKVLGKTLDDIFWNEDL